ncbi:MAG: efflux RND transporter periplasmic adaptor subunit [SAR324 cluster bacterium]|nr:efflux RND transporter periplasmic adaptor subunit [SAR324 cluster bacterium]
MKRLLKIVVILVTVSIFSGTLFFLYQKSRTKPVIFETGKPFVTDIIKKTVVNGTIIPRKEIEIKPLLIGIIDEIYLEPGSIIKAGDIIAKIKVIPNMISLNNAETRFNQAKIGLEDAHISFRRQKKFFEDAYTDGQLMIQKSNPYMIQLNSALFRSSRAKLVLDDVGKKYKRQKALLEKAIISNDDFQVIELALKEAKEELKGASNNYQLVREETIQTIEQEYQKAQLVLKKAEEEFEAAKNNLQLIREGTTAGKTEETNTLIRSTISGTVLDVLVKEGNLVIESSISSVGTTVAIIADMDDMIFEGNIDESEVGKIKEGMNLSLTIGAIEGEKFDAVIEAIAPQGKQIAGAIQFSIRAKINLKKSVFVRAGYSANADIMLEKKTAVVAIKESWLQFKNEATFVEVETAPQVFAKKQVAVGLSDGINIEMPDSAEEPSKEQIAQRIVESDSYSSTQDGATDVVPESGIVVSSPNLE